MQNSSDPLVRMLADKYSEQYHAIDVSLSEFRKGDSERDNAYDTLREAGIGRDLISRIETLSNHYNSAAQLAATLTE
jgi:hypothetical protein